MEDLKGMAVGEIMTPDPSTIKEHETMEQARVMMWRMDVRVLPVVDQVGRLSGMIGIKDIVKLSLNPPATETRGEFIGEKDADVEDLEVRSLMVEPPITTSPDEDLQEAARKISENDISALVVLEDGEIKGILTQIDLIELIASLREVDQAYVQITGLEEGLDVIWAMHGSIQKYLQLFGQIIRPRVMNVHVVPYHRGGRETKYSLKLRLQTDKGMFFAKNHGWNLVQVLDEALETLRREVVHEKEKRLERVKEASRG
jgi:CBS domain-containing protein/ribosome-associated translation inhibitor RaiA